MKKIFYLYSKSLLSKLALMAILIVGGGSSVWANTTVVEGNIINSPWETIAASISGYPGSSAYTSVNAFSIDNTNYIYGSSNYSWYYLRTTSSIALLKGQKIVINARSANGVSTGNYVGNPEIKIRYSTNNTSWTVLNEFTSTDINTKGTFADIQTNELSSNDSYYFQIFGKGVYLASIVIKDAEAATTPVLKLNPDEATTFGNVIADATKTYNVQNTGLGTMDVSFNFENDEANGFSITDEEGNVITSLTGITNDEVGKNFRVKFNFDENSLGNHNATINISATSPGDFVEWNSSASISASATAKDPNLWEEDFSSGIPSTWTNESNKWTVPSSGTYSGAASCGYNLGDPALITPRLQAKAGNMTLQFDEKVANSGSSYYLKVDYSTDLVNWTPIETYSYSSSFTTQSWTAPAEGYYWVRFHGYNAYIDNLSGLKLAPAMNEIAIASSSIPSSCLQFKEYTATVTVKEIGGLDEEVTTELYVNDQKVATATDIISANSDRTIELVFTPTTVLTEGTTYIKVWYDNNSSSKQTDDSNIYVTAPALTLDENNSTSWSTGNYSSVLVKYTPVSGWNTICLPFSMSSHLNKIVGNGWKAYQLNSYSNGTLTFSQNNYPGYSQPFLVYIEEAATHDNGVLLENISISNTSAASSTKSVAKFQGTYAPITAGNFTRDMYGVTSAGQVRPGDGVNANMKGYRAYFTGISAPSTSGARISIVFEDGGETTDLGFVKMVDPEAQDVYTLSGQKVKKGGKGIYIVNGRKVVIK